MKAIILTAGEGTRLRPLTVSWPKGLIPVANRPILTYIVEALRDAGILEIVMVVGYKKERVMSVFGDGSNFGVKIEYVVQKSPTGTAHAMLQAKNKVEGQFVLVPGDNLISSQAISDLLEVKDCEVAMLFSRSQTPSKYGVIGLNGEVVQSIIEKPKITGDLTVAGIPSIMSLALWEDKEKTLSDLISTGIYRFSSDIFKLIEDLKDDGESKLTTVIQNIIERKKKVLAVQTDSWVDAVYPWDLLRVNAKALKSITTTRGGTIEDWVHQNGDVSVGEDSLIRSGTYIDGPVAVGSNCDIGPSTHLSGATSVGDNVTIGSFTTIQNSLIMNDVQIGPGCTISNTVIGPGTRIGANFSVQKGGATIQLVGEKPLTVQDIGAIIGEDCTIGQNVVAAPGTIIGAQCSITSLRMLRENLPNGSRVM